MEQNLTSALPTAYYIAARRGLDSLMDKRLPASARLSPEILQVALRGLMTLRELELNETHRMIFGPKASRLCSASNCPSHTPTGPVALEAFSITSRVSLSWGRTCSEVSGAPRVSRRRSSMCWPRHLYYLCDKVAVWACGVEEEGPGNVT